MRIYEASHLQYESQEEKATIGNITAKPYWTKLSICFVFSIWAIIAFQLRVNGQLTCLSYISELLKLLSGYSVVNAS